MGDIVGQWRTAGNEKILNVSNDGTFYLIANNFSSPDGSYDYSYDKDVEKGYITLDPDYLHYKDNFTYEIEWIDENTIKLDNETYIRE